MKKFLSVVILLTALLVGGCGGEILFENVTPNDIHVSGNDAGNLIIKKETFMPIVVPEGSIIQVDAKLSAGRLVIKAEGEEYVIDKSGETFIDVPAGDREFFLAAQNGMTGDVFLRAVPKN